MQKKDRNSSIELLRCISMLLIVGFHLYGHSDSGNLRYLPFSFNKLVLMLVGSWGIVGVDCFVMITAWFMLEATSFKSKQLLSVIVETVFYSLFLYSIMGWFTGTGITIKGLFKEFISFAYDEYWFVTAYLVLLLLAPLFNFVIRKMNNIQLKVAAGLLFLLMSVWKFLLWDSPVSTIGLFSAIYFITAWMKRTKEMNFFNKKRNLVVIMLTCVTLILSICYSILPEGIRLSGVSKYLYVTLLAKNSPFMLGIAISLFYKFMSHNFSSKIINFLGKHSFSVYLIHENSYVYPTMWGYFVIKELMSSPFFICEVIIIILGIFISCVLFDFILAVIYNAINALLLKLVTPFLKYLDSVMNVFYKDNYL